MAGDGRGMAVPQPSPSFSDSLTWALLWLSGVGVIGLGLGVLTWTGSHQLALVHEAVGIILVVSLWVLAAKAVRVAAPRWVLPGALLWGAAVAVFGGTHHRLVPADLRWLVDVLHLVVGLVTIALGQWSWARYRSAGGRSDARIAERPEP